MDNQIPNEIIDRMAGKDGTEPVGDPELRAHSPDSWLAAMDTELLPAKARVRLADACVEYLPFVGVARRLAEQVTFGYAIAREITAPQHWERLQTAVQRSGLRQADTHEKYVRALGRLLVNRQLIFLCLRVLFSKAILRGLANLFADPEKEIRLHAVKALKSYPLEQVEEDIVNCLEDTAEIVRNEAMAILKEKMPPERLAEIVGAAREEAEMLKDAAKSAQDSVLSMPTDAPGLSKFMAVMRTALSGIGDATKKAVSSIGDAASSAASSISAAWSRMKDKKRIKVDEPAEAVVALAMALAWADGPLDDNRAAVTLVQDRFSNAV
jgi:tellurite resistance protein